jgi:hypothetical protein
MLVQIMIVLIKLHIVYRLDKMDIKRHQKIYTI